MPTARRCPGFRRRSGLGRGMFLTGNALTEEIERVLAGEDLRCAVAFWGKGAKARIPASHFGSARLICNLQSGGTNPHEIEALIKAGAQVRMHARLHAKVYISNAGAVTGSANMSANGLGLEGREQSRWEEAGISTDDTRDMADWFETLWTDDATTEISPAAMAAAIEAWEARQQVKPTIASFADVDASDLEHLIEWEGPKDFVPHAQSVRGQLGHYDARVERRIGNGLDIEGKRDHKLSGRWVLYWTRLDDKGRPRKNSFEWVKLGPPVLDALHREGEEDVKGQDVLIEAEEKFPIPFVVRDEIFHAAFWECMGRKRYADLRKDDKSKARYSDARLNLMKSFWADLHDLYLDMSDSTGKRRR